VGMRACVYVCVLNNPLKMYHSSQTTTVTQKPREVLKTQQQINTRCWSTMYKVYVGGPTENLAKFSTANLLTFHCIFVMCQRSPTHTCYLLCLQLHTVGP